MPNKDKRRKARQSRLSVVALAQAAKDAAGGPLAELAALDAPTGSWLAAPVISAGTVAGGDSGGGSGGPWQGVMGGGSFCEIGDEIDWRLVDTAVDHFDSCNWPTLDDLAHPLVEATGGAEAVGMPGAAGDCSGGLEPPVADPSIVRLGCCALVTKHRHAIVLRDVEVHTVADGCPALVAGQYAPRTIRTNIRMQGDDGWQNRPGRREAGVPTCEARALPVRSAALRPLRCLPRVLWRLEHIALVHEIVAAVEAAQQAQDMVGSAQQAQDGAGGRGGSDGGGGGGILGGGSLALEGDPRGVGSRSAAAAPGSACRILKHLRGLPLGTMSCALTSKGANAEAADGAPSDSRGCAHYELLEWLGDAVLELLAVVRVMADSPEASEGVCTRKKELLVSNLALCKDAASLGLPEMCLHRAFCSGTPLPELRRQLLSRKEQADLVEALLGLVAYHHGGCAAGSTGGEHTRGTGLAPREGGCGRDGELGVLGSALEAAGRFFDDCVAPRHPPTDMAPLSVRASVRLGSLSFVRPLDAAGRFGQTDRAVRLEAALGMRFTRRLDLLEEVAFGWNRDPPFQRLELLGDAVLGFCISFELMGLRASAADTGPPTEGELTQARSALVSNRSLGRRLIRRVGAALSVQLLGRGEAGEDLDAAASRIAPGWDAPGACGVVQAGASVRSLLVDLAPPPEGELSDVGKQAGDVYEALVGLVLLESDGDIDAAWRVVRGDFFEEDAVRGARGGMGAVEAAVRESATLQREALYSQVRCKAKAAALEQAARAQDRAELQAGPGGAGASGLVHGAQPAADAEMTTLAPAAGVDVHAQTAAHDGGEAARPAGAPVAASHPAPVTSHDNHAAAAEQRGTAALAGPVAAAREAATGSHPPAGSGAPPQQQDWVSWVNLLLQSNRCDPAAALENEECSAKQAPFVWRVYDKICPARLLLGEATSYRKKKEAKNLAYEQVHAALKLRFGDGGDRPPPAHTPAAPAVELQEAGSAMDVEASAQPSGQLPIAKPPAKRIKAPPLGPMAKAARVSAATPRDDGACAGTPDGTSACVDGLLDDMQEVNDSYRKRIQRLAARLALPDDELCAIAASAKKDAPHLRHGEAKVARSAGRLFYDRLKDKASAGLPEGGSCVAGGSSLRRVGPLRGKEPSEAERPEVLASRACAFEAGCD
jgi:dsRNA-specific ribonuclease